MRIFSLFAYTLGISVTGLMIVWIELRVVNLLTNQMYNSSK